MVKKFHSEHYTTPNCLNLILYYDKQKIKTLSQKTTVSVKKRTEKRFCRRSGTFGKWNSSPMRTEAPEDIHHWERSGETNGGRTSGGRNRAPQVFDELPRRASVVCMSAGDGGCQTRE